MRRAKRHVREPEADNGQSGPPSEDTMLALEVVTLCLVALAMTLALAHALEYPGKMRLSRDNYTATQTIYYPGFSLGGFAEPAGIVTTLLLMLLTPPANSAFLWIVAAFVSIAAMHLVYWTATHPVNRFWMSGVTNQPARRFFSLNPVRGSEISGAGYQDRWEELRNRWERSHIIRAALGAMSFLSLTIALAAPRNKLIQGTNLTGSLMRFAGASMHKENL